MRKLVIFFLVFLLQASSCFAFGGSINEAISKTNLDRESVISVSIKEADTANTVYKKKETMLLNPASSLKVFTMAAALNTLGDNYNFETAVYLDNDNNLYLKLGADPLFKTKDLDFLVSKLKLSYKNKIKYIYIDDSIIDNIPYPGGWTIDDFWPNAPMISPYMIDNNTVEITLSILQGKNNIYITQPSTYQFAFINQMTVSDKLNKTDKAKIVPRLDYGENANIITLTGSIDADTKYKMPVISPKAFYISKLSDSFKKYDISYPKQFYFKKVPANAKKIASFKRPITEVLGYTLEKSDNLSAEMLLKVAGASYVAKNAKNYKTSLGTTENGILMFYDYYKTAGINVDSVKVVDASGVSRYNAMSTFWMSDALIYLSKNSKIKDYMVQPGMGTLSSRLLNLKNDLRAKTGTLFGTSSLVGYIKAYSGKQYVFALIIQNFERRASIIKGLEDDIINAIWEL